MLVKPTRILDRDTEWAALDRFVARRQSLAVVYGPRRVGKSYLLDGLCGAAGGYRYQAIEGLPAAQLADFGRAVGQWLGAGPLQLSGWTDALERLGRVDAAVVVIDELPYLLGSTPELPSILQRFVDAGDGPPMMVAGSAMSTMTDLVSPRAPLYGRAAAVLVPLPFAGRDLAKLWQVTDPTAALWIDAAVGGLPGYRPMLAPPGKSLDRWMVDEVLAPSSPLLDAAEATLAEATPSTSRGLFHTVLSAIASGERTFSGIGRVTGRPSGALTRPLALLERSGLVVRVPDPLRARRYAYDLGDPHLRFWLSIVAPNRTALAAGNAPAVWASVQETTWRAQVLGPRWERVVRSWLAAGEGERIGPVDTVGTTTVADRSERTTYEVDVIAQRGREVVALGEAKLRRLGGADLERLRRIRDLLGTPEAKLVLASAESVDVRGSDVVAITPRTVYR